MRTVQLDTNCLIYLDNDTRPHSNHVRKIVSAWRRGELEVVLAAISASENARAEEEPQFQEFERLLRRVRVHKARLLPAMAYWDVVYWGHALWVDDEMLALETQIHTILAPTLAMDDQRNMRKWRNVKCDVQMVWTHIWHSSDTLVTADERLIRKAPALAQLGARIERLADFARSLT